MLWGNGDTSKLAQEEQETLSHLRRMVETGHIVALNEKQSQTALRAIDFYTQFESVFRLLTTIRNAVGLLGFLFLGWWATQGWVLERLLGDAPK